MRWTEIAGGGTRTYVLGICLNAGALIRAFVLPYRRASGPPGQEAGKERQWPSWSSTTSDRVLQSNQ
jgi:hypothetical protein